MPHAPTHLLLVEDDVDLRTNLQAWLRLAGYAVHAAADAEAALALAGRHPIALAVLDFRLPGMSGLDLMGILQARDPGMKAIFLSGESTMEVAIAALREGRAFDFLQKPLLDLSLLGTAISRALALGSQVIPPPRLGRIDGLSPREQQILRLLAHGMSNQGIASQLGRTEKTIRNQLSDIYAKIGATNRTQAVIAWQQASAGH